MASITVASNAIVLEVLDQHNYEDWSSRVEIYLLAEDLWDVVNTEPPKREDGDAKYKAWTTKNARALHAITISCGPQLFSFIRKTRTAKIAWEILEKNFKSSYILHLEKKEREERNRSLHTEIDSAREELTPADEDLEIKYGEGGNQNNSNYEFDSTYQPFFDSVVNGDWMNAKESLATLLLPNVLRARNPADRGRTALHVAAKKGHVHIVRELVLLMPQEDLELRADNGCTALHIAVRKGNVDIVKELAPLMRQQALGIKNISGDTALHIAALNGNVHIVKKLVELMREEDLEIGDSNGCHALHLAAWNGDVHNVKELVAFMREEALEIIDGEGYTALGWAILLCRERGDEYSEGEVIEMIKPMVAKNQKILGIVGPPFDYIPVVEACRWLKFQVGRYLYSITPGEALMPPENGSQGASLIWFNLKANQFDIPWDLILNCPRLAMVEDARGVNSPILVLSRMHSAFLNGMRLKFWQKWIYDSIKIQAPAFRDVHDLSVAVSNTEDDGVTQRDLVISAVSLLKRLLKSLLEVLGNLSPFSQSDRIQGASLQMQRELQWFKEVESVIPQAIRESRNASDDLTARELFHKNHVNLMVEAEISMKGIATSCTVVGALIVTIMFAAAFTIPGGNNGTTGLPMFINENLFLVFIASDIISLVFSTTSVIMFLGILTSRYAAEDFLKNIPAKMMVGLSTLFIAIATMMIAFSCGLVIMLHEKYSWVAIPVILVASIPVASFVWMLFPLLVQTFISTYGPGIFNKKVKRWY